MSTAQLGGNAAGSGNLLLQAPATNSNLTVNFPDAGGTAMVSGAMPAFSGYTTSNITVSNNSVTTLNFGTKQFDTASAYSGNTFTVPVTGFYQWNITVAWSGDISGSWSVAPFINGSAPFPNASMISTSTSTGTMHALSGSIMLYLVAGQSLTWVVYQTTGATKYVTAGGETFLTGGLVRVA